MPSPLDVNPNPAVVANVNRRQNIYANDCGIPGFHSFRGYVDGYDGRGGDTEPNTPVEGESFETHVTNSTDNSATGVLNERPQFDGPSAYGTPELAPGSPHGDDSLPSTQRGSPELGPPDGESSPNRIRMPVANMGFNVGGTSDPDPNPNLIPGSYLRLNMDAQDNNVDEDRRFDAEEQRAGDRERARREAESRALYEFDMLQFRRRRMR
jgi:hypothetical protein